MLSAHQREREAGVTPSELSKDKANVRALALPDVSIGLSPLVAGLDIEVKTRARAVDSRVIIVR